MIRPTKNSEVYSIKLPKKLITLLLNEYGFDTFSHAVITVMDFMFFMPSSEINSDSAMIGKYTNISERKLWEYKSIRIHPLYMKLFIEKMRPYCNSTVKGLYGVSSKYSEAILLAVLNYMNHFDHGFVSDIPLGKECKVINILGSKWCSEMTDAISIILSTSALDIDTTVETCAGALGILANHHIINTTEIINDDDWEKINLYRCIQKYPLELIEKCINFDITKDEFFKLKKRLSSIKTDNTIDVDAAASFYIMNKISYRNSGNTLNNKISPENYRQKCLNILNLHRRLKGVYINEGDLFKQISKHKNEQHTLIFCDPPYLDTNCYKGRIITTETDHSDNFDIAEHIKLAKALNSIKGYFIYFCRITATRSTNVKGELTVSSDELKERDMLLKTKIDDLYCQEGNFFIDVELKKDKGIERIITNFPFAGSTPYLDEERGCC